MSNKKLKYEQNWMRSTQFLNNLNQFHSIRIKTKEILEGKIITNDLNRDNQVNFFSDFRQLDYVKIVSYEIGSGN